jgi:hypothetical protein
MSEERGFYDAAMRTTEPFDAGALIATATVDAITARTLSAIQNTVAHLLRTNQELAARVAALEDIINAEIEDV